jgi:hypothetical protein
MFILGLAKVVHELIVGYNIFELIVIHRDNKLHKIQLIYKIVIVILNSTNDTSMVMGAIFLFFHEISMTNPIVRINYRKLAMTILLPSHCPAHMEWSNYCPSPHQVTQSYQQQCWVHQEEWSQGQWGLDFIMTLPAGSHLTWLQQEDCDQQEQEQTRPWR